MSKHQWKISAYSTNASTAMLKIITGKKVMKPSFSYFVYFEFSYIRMKCIASVQHSTPEHCVQGPGEGHGAGPSLCGVHAAGTLLGVGFLQDPSVGHCSEDSNVIIILFSWHSRGKQSSRQDYCRQPPGSHRLTTAMNFSLF